MSTTKVHKWLWLGTLVAVAASFVGTADEIDPVLRYYWERAGETVLLLNPARPGISYSFMAKSYARQISSHGEIIRTDSMMADYYFSGGTLDSQISRLGGNSRFERLELSFPNVFEIAYHLNLFPNDTGGDDLAIGLTADSADGPLPDGLVIIDRTEYQPRRLYLFYPEKEGYTRFTRSFRLVLVDGFVFPDSILEVGTRIGIFSKENYRLETGITNIQVRR